MSQASHYGPAPPGLDADPEEVARELRRQIAAVRRRMEEHRETMEAAGLISPAEAARRRRPPPCTEL